MSDTPPTSSSQTTVVLTSPSPQPPRPVPITKAFKFDGTVTAGNLITALTVLSTLLIWGVRLEDRVTAESDLRSRLETRVDNGFAEVTRRVEASAVDARSRADEIKQGLTHLDDRIQQFFMQDRRDTPRAPASNQ